MPGKTMRLGWCTMMCVLVLLGLARQPAQAFVMQIVSEYYECSASASTVIREDDDIHSPVVTSKYNSQKGVYSASASVSNASAWASLGYGSSDPWNFVSFQASGWASSYCMMISSYASSSFTGEVSFLILPEAGESNLSAALICNYGIYVWGEGAPNGYVGVLFNGSPVQSSLYYPLQVGELNTLKFGGSAYTADSFHGQSYGAIGGLSYRVTAPLNSPPLDPPAAPLPGTFLLLGSGMGLVALSRRLRFLV